MLNKNRFNQIQRDKRSTSAQANPGFSDLPGRIEKRTRCDFVFERWRNLSLQRDYMGTNFGSCVVGMPRKRVDDFWRMQLHEQR
ncbi:hypothetical protein BGC_27130 [Burkholderia sp. 3C]